MFGSFVRAVVIAASVMSAPAFAGSFDEAVLDELNHARQNPRTYARELRGLDHDDPEAVEEAIAFLERQPALAPLASDKRIAAAAREHVHVQGPSGEVGHGPAGGLGRRLRDNGVWAGLSAENISYGYDDPREVVRQQIIDSQVAGRGHRRNIFTAAYRVAGVACGPHREYGSMCVIDFAGAMVER